MRRIKALAVLGLAFILWALVPAAASAKEYASATITWVAADHDRYDCCRHRRHCRRHHRHHCGCEDRYQY